MTEINIYKTSSDVFRFISKRWWIIVLFAGIGILIGYLKTPLPKKPKYETQLIGEVKNISNIAVANIINTLASSANKNDFEQLAVQLSLDEKIAKNICGLRAKAYVNTDPLENSNNNVFTVIVITSNYNALPPFIQSLKTYVNNDPLFANKGSINISPKFNISKTPINVHKENLPRKYGILFFVLGIAFAIIFNFIVNVRKYQKTQM